MISGHRASLDNLDPPCTCSPLLGIHTSQHILHTLASVLYQWSLSAWRKPQPLGTKWSSAISNRDDQLQAVTVLLFFDHCIATTYWFIVITQVWPPHSLNVAVSAHKNCMHVQILWQRTFCMANSNPSVQGAIQLLLWNYYNSEITWLISGPLLQRWEW